MKRTNEWDCCPWQLQLKVGIGSFTLYSTSFMKLNFDICYIGDWYEAVQLNFWNTFIISYF